MIEAVPSTSLPLSAISFFHPSLAGLAVAAGLVPLIIHLIQRRRYQVVDWAAVTFLLAAYRRSARRIWVEQWLVLGCRILVVVLLGLALARPYFPAGSATRLGRERVHRILLLDDSASMRARAGDGGPRFAEAIRTAQALIDSLPPGDPVTLVRCTDVASDRLPTATYDRRHLREQLNQVGASLRTADAAAVCARASEIIATTDLPPGSTAVYYISDFCTRDWLSEGTAAAATIPAIQQLADQASLTLLQVAAANAPDASNAPIASEANLAVTTFAPTTALVGAQIPVRLRATVANLGARNATGEALHLLRGGQLLRRLDVPPLEPGESTDIEATTLLAAPGSYEFEVRLVSRAPDALEHDDRRHVIVEARSRTPILLVDGKPGPARLDGQVGYFATALDPALSPEDPQLLAPRVITELDLAGEALPDYAAVVLANVDRLPREQWDTLARYVENGGGLIIFLGDRVRAEHYNESTMRDGTSWLPGTLGSLGVGADAAAPVAGSAPSGEEFVRFAPNDLQHPIVVPFAGEPNSGLFLARIKQYVQVQPHRARADVILRYTDGRPAWLGSTLGRGRILLCTTSCNMDWNNLAAKGDFVSLCLGVVQYAAAGARTAKNLTVGEAIEYPLTARESALPLQLLVPEGGAHPGRIMPAATGLAYVSQPTEAAGVHTLRIGDEPHLYAVHPPMEESALRTATTAQLKEALGEFAHVQSAATATAELDRQSYTRELALPLLVLAVLLLMAEVWLAMWFGSRREVAE
jgi:hypothetical protein